MYLSSNNYPEFSDKDKKFKKECLSYCSDKTDYSKRFNLVVGVGILLTFFWLALLEDLIFGEVNGLYNLVFPVLLGVSFYIYLLIEVNTTIHKSVQAHIDEFEKEYEQLS